MTFDELLQYVDDDAKGAARRILEPLFDIPKDDLGALAERIELARARGIVDKQRGSLKAASVLGVLKDLVWAVWRAR